MKTCTAFYKYYVLPCKVCIYGVGVMQYVADNCAIISDISIFSNTADIDISRLSFGDSAQKQHSMFTV